jgi:hypothetical protein
MLIKPGSAPRFKHFPEKISPIRTGWSAPRCTITFQISMAFERFNH